MGTLTRPLVQSGFLYHRLECLSCLSRIDFCEHPRELQQNESRILAATYIAGIKSTHSDVTLELLLHTIPSHFAPQGSLDFPQLAGKFVHFFIKDLRAAAARGRRKTTTCQPTFGYSMTSNENIRKLFRCFTNKHILRKKYSTLKSSIIWLKQMYRNGIKQRLQKVCRA